MPRFIQPNFHVLLVHLPIALLMMGLLIELFGFLWKQSTARLAARWMILLGTLAMLPTITSGIFAYLDVVSQGTMQQSDYWHKTAADAGLSAEQWEVLHDHFLFAAIAAGVVLLTVVTWVGSSDLWRRRLYVPALGLLLIAGFMMSVAAHHGGQAVYVQQLAVKDRTPVIHASNVPFHQLNRQEKIAKFLAPFQMHLIMAGLTLAMAAGALSLSLRAASRAREIALANRQPAQTSSERLDVTEQTTPSARFWLIAGLLAILTIVSGLYIGDFLFRKHLFEGLKLKSEVWRIATNYHNRIALHVVFGASILVLSLILAGLGRWLPRRRILLAGFALLLTLAVAGQILVGTLLLLDGDEGLAYWFKSDGQMAGIHDEATRLKPATAAPDRAGPAD